MRLGRGTIAAFVLGASTLGCVGDPRVVRVYDGRIIEGPFVPPEAYASYLKGVLAEEAGDLRSALAAYEQTSREDDEDPEPLSRIADVRCRLDPKDKGVDEALSKALQIDPTYAPALAAKARCLGARGHAPDGIVLVDRVDPADRRGADLGALFVRLAAQRKDGAADTVARQRAIAFTVESGEHAAAWDALIAWGRAKSDGELLARGLEGLVRVAPLRSREVEAGVIELLGIGHAALARRVAATIADTSPEHGIHLVHDPTVARLAVDEAILAGNGEKVERRATRGHVQIGEVAARALILERPELARPLAEIVTSADPTAGCATMVSSALAAREGKPPLRTNEMTTRPVGDRPATACVLVFAERLAAMDSGESARVWAARVAPAPMAPHDPAVGALAVDLAARGVVPPASLPLELRLELAARRREPPPAVDAIAIDQHVVDPKHALLWHMLIDPSGAPARTLLGRMHRAADRDPIIGFSLARAALAAAPTSPTGDAWSTVFRALAADPADPLLLAAAVEIAKKAGRAEDVPPARARLMAVARTPAERALAGE